LLGAYHKEMVTYIVMIYGNYFIKKLGGSFMKISFKSVQTVIENVGRAHTILRKSN